MTGLIVPIRIGRFGCGSCSHQSQIADPVSKVHLTQKRKNKKTRKFTTKEPREIALQTRILRAAQAADAARDRAGRPSAKQIGSRATLTILEKLEAREKKRAQQKKERKFTDRPPGAPRDCSANADFKGCPSC